jgi:hypothetical protein
LTVTPEQIEAIGKVVIGIIASVGAIVSTITAYWTARTRRDTHYLGDKIRSVAGEPLQYRYDHAKRDVAKAMDDLPKSGDTK